MSLDDKLNPNDGTLIDTVDNILFSINKKIAQFWQNKTYRSKRDLEQTLYLTSVASFGYFMIKYTGNMSGFLKFNAGALAAFDTLSAFDKDCCPNLLKEQKKEIIYESYKLPKKLSKYARIMASFGGVLLIGTGITYLAGGLIAKKPEFCAAGTSLLAFGIGYYGGVSADYISLADIENPPPKPKKKPVLEQLKDLMGRLGRTPVPEYDYSDISYQSAVTNNI